jgi:hypothetical protein
MSLATSSNGVKEQESHYAVRVTSDQITRALGGLNLMSSNEDKS